jgi:hypothetical protein
MEMKEFIEEVQMIMSGVIDISTHKNGACLYMGALLFANINDRFPVKARFVTGSLTVNNRLIFSHEPIKPVLNSGMDFSGQWNGHAWVEVDGYIFDPSIFFTIYSPTTAKELQALFKTTFKCKYLLEPAIKLERKCIFYKEYEELADADATVLINSGLKLGFFDESRF